MAEKVLFVPKSLTTTGGVGAGVTNRVTETLRLAIPGPPIKTIPVYAPTVKGWAREFTSAARVAGAAPDVGVTVSHGTLDEAVQERAPLPPFAIWIGSPSGILAPKVYTNWRFVVDTAMLGSPTLVERVLTQTGEERGPSPLTFESSAV